MTVKEYLSDFNTYLNVTFLLVHARKTPQQISYHEEYQPTPIRTIEDWGNSDLMNYIVLNNKQCPVDWLCGVPWRNMFNRGDLMSLLIISEEDFALLFPSKEQRDSLVSFIDRSIKDNK